MIAIGCRCPLFLMSSPSARSSSGDMRGKSSAAGCTGKRARQLRPCWEGGFVLNVTAKAPGWRLDFKTPTQIEPGLLPGLLLFRLQRSRYRVSAACSGSSTFSIDADGLREQTVPGPAIDRPCADAMPLCERAMRFELFRALLPLRRGIRDGDGGGHVASHRSDYDGAN